MSRKVTAKFITEQEKRITMVLLSKYFDYNKNNNSVNYSHYHNKLDLNRMNFKPRLELALREHPEFDLVESFMINLSYHHPKGPMHVGSVLKDFHPEIVERENYLQQVRLSKNEIAALDAALPILERLKILYGSKKTYGTHILLEEIHKDGLLNPDLVEKIEDPKSKLAHKEWGQKIEAALAPLRELQFSHTYYRKQITFSHVTTLSDRLVREGATQEEAIAAYDELDTRVENCINDFIELLLNPPTLLSLSVDLKAVEDQENDDTIADYLEFS